MDDISSKDIRLSAMNLLARREHSRRELQEKLNKRFNKSDLTKAVISQLEAEGLLSDKRYSESFIHGRANKLYGPERIRHELRQAGINEELIEIQLQESGIDWKGCLQRLRQKKFGNIPAKTPEERAKQQRYFHYRGFGSSAIRELEKTANN